MIGILTLTTAVHDIDNWEKDDAANNDGERRDQLGQTVKNDTNDKMQEELIRQELDGDVIHGRLRLACFHSNAISFII